MIYISPKKQLIAALLLITLLSILVASVHGMDSKNTITGPAIQKENVGKELFKAVECTRENNKINISRGYEKIINNTTEYDYNNNTACITDGVVNINNQEEPMNITEPVIEYKNTKTVYAQASSYMDSYYPPGVWYEVVWDLDKLYSYYGYCDFNIKNVYENEITVIEHGRYYSCDFSALTGLGKIRIRM